MPERDCGTGVSHTLSGDVIVVDMGPEVDVRFDLTPAQAEKGASDCEAIAGRRGWNAVSIATKYDRTLRFVGNSEAMSRLARDLRTHAGMAKLRNMEHAPAQ